MRCVAAFYCLQNIYRFVFISQRGFQTIRLIFSGYRCATAAVAAVDVGVVDHYFTIAHFPFYSSHRFLCILYMKFLLRKSPGMKEGGKMVENCLTCHRL